MRLLGLDIGSVISKAVLMDESFYAQRFAQKKVRKIV
jgi:activator of 2-hydroxyglutaryl-CoA dehydratase